MSLPFRIEARLANTPAEIDAAQRLRYSVFHEEWGATASDQQRASRRDADAHDARMDHLIVIDHARPPCEGQVVGTYRLRRRDANESASADGYTSAEFDVSPLVSTGERTLELGRSCVLREYRGRAVLNLLWGAIAAYVADHGIGLMFGCASLRGTDPMKLREQLAYLHHFHLAPRHIRPRAIGADSTRMDLLEKAWIDPRRAFSKLEPLVKGYLRLGASVGEGACIDRAFNSVDICIVMPTAQLTRRYVNHYERALKRPLCRLDDVATPEAAIAGSA
ncbi:GNAT family N-acetyltransferase [Cognatiluteimonas profundi]|uniref:GNAT family N-acetyltransferase n=1 Tax=Cognatiluteimonas profundi TaxID=2594501 RepID=UPI00131B3169|nr:GNAT family N-acyltransferase [Lysobacter profundi]